MPEATALSFFVLALLCYDRWAEASRPWPACTGGRVHGAGSARQANLHLSRSAGPRHRCRTPGLARPAPARSVAHGRGQPGPSWPVAPARQRPVPAVRKYLRSIVRRRQQIRPTERSSLALVLLGAAQAGNPLGIPGPCGSCRDRRRRSSMAPTGNDPGARRTRDPRSACVVLGRYTQQPWGIQYHVYAIPFASVLFGIGCTWLLARLPGRLGHVSVAVVVASFVPASAYVYHGLLMAPPSLEQSCGEAVARVVPASSRIIVTSSQREWDRGVPNNYRSPSSSFTRTDSAGVCPPTASRWSVPAATVEREGSTFVVTAPERLASAPELRGYLAREANVALAGEDGFCRVYAFRSSKPAAAPQ